MLASQRLKYDHPLFAFKKWRAQSLTFPPFTEFTQDCIIMMKEEIELAEGQRNTGNVLGRDITLPQKKCHFCEPGLFCSRTQYSVNTMVDFYQKARNVNAVKSLKSILRFLFMYSVWICSMSLLITIYMFVVPIFYFDLTFPKGYVILNNHVRLKFLYNSVI